MCFFASACLFWGCVSEELQKESLYIPLTKEENSALQKIWDDTDKIIFHGRFRVYGEYKITDKDDIKKILNILKPHSTQKLNYSTGALPRCVFICYKNNNEIAEIALLQGNIYQIFYQKGLISFEYKKTQDSDGTFKPHEKYKELIEYIEKKYMKPEYKLP